MQIGAVAIQGDFIDDEWQCVVEVIGSIERDHPTDDYQIATLDTAVVIKGPFSEDEWKSIVNVIRAIERDHPNQTYFITALDTGEASIQEARDLLERTFPRIAGETPHFTTYSR